MDLVAIGLRIRNCRKSLKLTQEELAEKIDVSSHYIYEIEKGLKTMSLGILEQISQTLQVSTDYIIFGIDTAQFQKSVPELSDRLYILAREIPIEKRDTVADILDIILPNLK